MAQVLFLDNPLSGVFILVGLAIKSAELVAYGAAGLVVSCATAHFMKLSQNSIRSGLFGYNGFLVGLACHTFVAERTEAAHYALVLLATVCMAAFSTLLTQSLGNFWKTFGVPPLTLPFNVSTLLFLQVQQSTSSSMLLLPFS